MASALKRSRTVSLSVERVLETLEQKGDCNDDMSSGKESDIYIVSCKKQATYIDRGVKCPA